MRSGNSRSFVERAHFASLRYCIVVGRDIASVRAGGEQLVHSLLEPATASHLINAVVGCCEFRKIAVVICSFDFRRSHD